MNSHLRWKIHCCEKHTALSHHISPEPLGALTPLSLLKECAEKSEVLQGQGQGTKQDTRDAPQPGRSRITAELEELGMSTEVTYPLCWICCFALATFLPATRVKTFFYLGGSSMAVMWDSLLPMGPGPTFPWCFQPNSMQGTRL